MVMANKEPTIAMYPKIGFLELIDITSDEIPIAGRIIIYTSGWPKNQNKCWNKIGEPPSLGRILPLINISLKKKLVPRFLSNNNNIAPDNKTGKDNTPRIAVKNNAHMVRGILVILMPLVRMFKIVVI